MTDCWQRLRSNEDSGRARGSGNNFGSRPRRNDHTAVMDDQIWLSMEERGELKKEPAREEVHKKIAESLDDEEMVLSGTNGTDRMDWVIDSGCTNHMTGNRQVFLEGSYQTLPSNKRQMKTATGELVSASGIGTVRADIWIPNKGYQHLFLTKVLYVPEELKDGLLSVSKLTKKSIKLAFSDKVAEFYKDGVLIAMAEKYNKLYKLVQDKPHSDLGFLGTQKDSSITTL